VSGICFRREIIFIIDQLIPYFNLTVYSLQSLSVVTTGCVDFGL